ncbi:hypothetical protein T09_1381 [Trichinella sp. T9]|nr:hypothetical protein T09_1381 [Trichinella sp. T9]
MKKCEFVLFIAIKFFFHRMSHQNPEYIKSSKMIPEILHNLQTLTFKWMQWRIRNSTLHFNGEYQIPLIYE